MDFYPGKFPLCLNGSVQSQESDSMILAGPFKLSIFCDSVNCCAYGKRGNMQNMVQQTQDSEKNQAMESCST